MEIVMDESKSFKKPSRAEGLILPILIIFYTLISVFSFVLTRNIGVRYIGVLSFIAAFILARKLVTAIWFIPKEIRFSEDRLELSYVYGIHRSVQISEISSISIPRWHRLVGENILSVRTRSAHNFLMSKELKGWESLLGQLERLNPDCKILVTT